MRMHRLVVCLVAFAGFAMASSPARAQGAAGAGTSGSQPAPGFVIELVVNRRCDTNGAGHCLSQAHGARKNPQLRLRRLRSISLSTAAASAGIQQAYSTPPEWGQGWDSYGVRLGSNYGIQLITTATRYALAEAFREDTIYYRCACHGFFPRLENALISTVTARRGADGHRVFSLAAIGAPYAGTMSAVARLVSQPLRTDGRLPHRELQPRGRGWREHRPRIHLRRPAHHARRRSTSLACTAAPKTPTRIPRTKQGAIVVAPSDPPAVWELPMRLPEEITITIRADGRELEGAFVSLRFDMSAKNAHYFLFGPSDVHQQIEVTRSQLIDKARKTTNLFLMDYHHIEPGWTGKLGVTPVNLEAVEAALKAYRQFRGGFEFPVWLRGVAQQSSCSLDSNPQRSAHGHHSLRNSGAGCDGGPFCSRDLISIVRT